MKLSFGDVREAVKAVDAYFADCDDRGDGLAYTDAQALVACVIDSIARTSETVAKIKPIWRGKCAGDCNEGHGPTCDDATCPDRGFHEQS